MNVYIYDDAETLGRAAAALIAGKVVAKPNAILGLATGSTPIPTYQALREMNHAGAVSFKNVRTFNLDEYVGLSPEHDQSYRYFMNTQLFDHVDIDKANTRVPSGFADAAQAAAYDDDIDAAGGIDIQLLGIGRNGHIGFNEPADDFSRTTHIVDLTENTIEANARFFASADDVPRKAVTMGIGTIMKARSVLLIATGVGKAETMRSMLCGPVTPSLPASILAFHPDVTVMMDKEAASLL